MQTVILATAEDLLTDLVGCPPCHVVGERVERSA